jgi:hypothetical protein
MTAVGCLQGTTIDRWRQDMEKTVAGVIGAVGALVAAQPHAASALPASFDAAMQASSYADLLKPIPNAQALLKAGAAERLPTANDADDDPAIQQVQYYHHHHYYYHHHHRYYHHHHHHHYRSGYYYYW